MKNFSFEELNLFTLNCVKIKRTYTNVVMRKNCISISSNQGKLKKDNVEKPNIVVNEVKLKINGIPQQKKCVRQLNSKKYEDKNLIINYFLLMNFNYVCYIITLNIYFNFKRNT